MVICTTHGFVTRGRSLHTLYHTFTTNFRPAAAVLHVLDMLTLGWASAALKVRTPASLPRSAWVVHLTQHDASLHVRSSYA